MVIFKKILLFRLELNCLFKNKAKNIKIQNYGL
jgi:hypothetical protein